MVSKVKQLLAKALTINMHAIRAGIHTTLGSISKIKNSRDMILTVPLVADWTAIVTMKREHLVNKRNLCKENNCKQQYEYTHNQMVP